MVFQMVGTYQHERSEQLEEFADKEGEFKMMIKEIDK